VANTLTVQAAGSPTGGETVRFLGSHATVHARVLPLDGQRPFVTGGVEGAHDSFPVQPAVTRGTLVPAAPRVVVVQVRAQQAASPIERDRHVLDVGVKDAVG